MKKYEITVYGCDDTTVVHMDLTPKQFELIKKLCDLVTETSTYQCMPTMEIKEEL